MFLEIQTGLAACRQRKLSQINYDSAKMDIHVLCLTLQTVLKHTNLVVADNIVSIHMDNGKNNLAPRYPRR